MSESPKLSPEQVNLFKAMLESLVTPEQSTPTARIGNAKGRRYGRAEKAAIIAEYEAGKKSDELFQRHGISRETLSRWIRRARKKSPAATTPANTAEQAPSCSSSPAVAAPEEAEDQHKGYHPHWREVLKTWRSRPGIGPGQIRNQLFRIGIKISVATVRKIIEENGYTPPKTTIKEVEINRYEAVRPLELVHMDFKHFYINKQKVYLLLLQDDFSRFLCGYRMTDSENMKAVIEAFEECVNRYGKMQTVMTDAGSAFYGWNGFNKFQKLMTDEYGVDQIKASSPRSNGKIENVNKQIEKEVLNVDRYASLEEAGEAIREWIRFYNFERTHMGLPQGMVPADRFLSGWNESADLSSRQRAEDKAWSDVMSFVQGKIKRAV